LEVRGNNKDNTKTYTRYPDPADFYQQIGKSDCDCGRSSGRLDPMLKLYSGCELMNTVNKDVLENALEFI